MVELSFLFDFVCGWYCYFKGGEYEVIDIVCSSEMLELMVFYCVFYGEGGLWVCFYLMFIEQVLGEYGLQVCFVCIDD